MSKEEIGVLAEIVDTGYEIQVVTSDGNHQTFPHGMVNGMWVDVRDASHKAVMWAMDNSDAIEFNPAPAEYLEYGIA